MSTLHNERRPLTPLVRGVALGLAAIGLAVGLSSLPFTLAAATPAIAAAPPPAAPVVPLRSTASYSAVVDRVAPSVVTVRVQMRPQATRMAMPAFPFFGQDDREAPARGASALGSGVIIREDGLVLTNHHVIADAARIRLDFADGRSLPATLVGSDAPSDLAVLRVDAHGLPALPFGDSERMKVGDVVLAFGNPLGVGQTVTMGIVSAKGRATGVGDGAYEDFLQTDAPINQGNSGGALVNLQGELGPIEVVVLTGRLSALHRFEVDDLGLQDVSLVILVEQKINRAGDDAVGGRNLKHRFNLSFTLEIPAEGRDIILCDFHCPVS